MVIPESPDQTCDQRAEPFRGGSRGEPPGSSPRAGPGYRLSWKSNQEVARDVTDLVARLPTADEFERYRAANGADAVMGFTWSEFCRVRHRGAVFASPVRNGLGEFVECVSLDASAGFPALDTTDVWHEINALCLALGDEGMHDV